MNVDQMASEWGEYDLDIVAEGFSFLEGPRWRDGRLYVSDFYSHRVLAIDDAGMVQTVCEVPHQPSGLGFTPHGELLVVSMLDRRLLKLTGTGLDVVADLSAFALGPANDMVVDRHGRAYIGNFGAAGENGDLEPSCLVRVDPDGSVAVAADDLVFPNGAVIAESGDRFIVSETFASRLTEFDIGSDGTLRQRRVWADFTDVDGRAVSTARSEPGTPVLPDGLALDAEGAVWVADAKGSGALRVRRGGTVLDGIDTGGLSVFAVTLGGHDRRTLYLCAAPPLQTEDPSQTTNSVLLRCRVDVPGTGRP